MFKNLRNYLDETREYIDVLERDMKTIEEEHLKADKSVDTYFNNPVNAYLLIKRLLIDWASYLKMVEENKPRLEFIAIHNANLEHLNYPTKDDLEGSAKAFARLQSAYQLDISHFASGIHNGIKYASEMSWEDCFHLGYLLYELRKFEETIPWMKIAFEKMGADEFLDDHTTIIIMEVVSNSNYELGYLNKALNITNAILDIDPMREESIERKFLIESELRQDASEKAPVELTYKQSREFKIYEELCRDAISRNPSEMRHLYCKYVNNNNPFLLIAPFKLEVMNTDPVVYIFHDVLSDEEVENIKSSAKPNLIPTEIKLDNGGNIRSDDRVSQGTWFKYESEPILEKIRTRVSDMTGLDTKNSAEELQVVNYGIGGQYEPHIDAFGNPNAYGNDTGNRIATALFYLTNVDVGGSTAFPHLNINVRPAKGNLLFWYNLHKDETIDYRTKHAGCPVMIGSKWIANIWIKVRNQEFLRKCDLQPDSVLSEPYKIVRWF